MIEINIGVGRVDIGLDFGYDEYGVIDLLLKSSGLFFICIWPICYRYRLPCFFFLSFLLF